MRHRSMASDSEAPVVLTLSKDSINVNPRSSYTWVSVYADGEPVVAGVSTSSGGFATATPNSTAFRVDYQSNPRGSSRSCNIVFSYKGSSAILQVNQEADYIQEITRAAITKVINISEKWEAERQSRSWMRVKYEIYKGTAWYSDGTIVSPPAPTGEIYDSGDQWTGNHYGGSVPEGNTFKFNCPTSGGLNRVNSYVALDAAYLKVTQPEDGVSGTVKYWLFTKGVSRTFTAKVKLSNSSEVDCFVTAKANWSSSSNIIVTFTVDQ